MTRNELIRYQLRDQKNTRSPEWNSAPGRSGPVVTMPCPTIGGPGRSILKIRGSFHWLHFIRRQGIGRPVGRNQPQKNAQLGSIHR